ncbi:2Fe-2S iron-sulfur cluster-binding family protein [Paenirhodobacter enshiensis]|uniref:2Fe-2S ferredoxin-type domain-containing protein n=1 Tax=Paenirhodobacter enshiensis TaxID=1105367 RepID=A0A086XSB6_9RHOB|nr:2Fe-2S iron-sulfur cluster-binding protein [Paenirhodobacter enshiensis]KFI24916.1 hypothetical protein CG50_07225 [Paenirhodobacter enshiensis]
MPDPITLIFRTAAGTETRVPATPGQSVMEAAVMNGVAGIEGECGGCLSCATCHVFAPEGLGTPGPDEDAMLDCTEVERGPRSRLSCQIAVTAAMDGAVFDIPAAE